MPLISNGATEQLPPWVTQPMRKKQASEVPWRKNLKSTGGGPAAPVPAPVPKTPAPKAATPAAKVAPAPKAAPAVKTTATNNNAQKPPAITAAAPPEQPKTTKLQINLKSVKKPDTPVQPTQTEKLPQVQLNPVLPENKTTTTNKPPTGKTIPIIIQKTSAPSADTAKPTVNTTTIPIQRPHNDPPANKTTPIKTESKVKSKPAQAKNTSKAASADPTPAAESKMAPPPPPPAPPAPPPPPGAPPPPPPPPGGPNAGLPPKAPKPAHVQAKIESLKKAPRKRPDWANMMKEIETGRKLKHVQCNDRSRPILPKSKSRGKFVFESEAKPATKAEAIHNRLLNEIQQGVKLKKVQCNDRSKPHLSGLRFRRQSSVADSDVQKVNETIPETEELAFVMDIDVLRDELQSSKQMLEMEVEAKHNVEKKNRDQKCQIIAMEAEIETLKAKLGLIPEEEVSMLTRGLDRSESRTFKHLRKSGSGLWKSPSIVGIKKSKSGISKELAKPTQQDGKNEQQGQQQQNEDELNEVSEFEEEICSLKQAVQHARKQAEEMERKYKETMEKLLVAQGTLEDSEQKRRVLEKKVETMQAVQSGKVSAAPVVQTAERTTQTEEQILERMLTRQQSTREDGGQDGLFTDSEEEGSDVEVDEETVQRKKEEREIKLWENKLKSIKEKQHASRLERRNLKNLQKNMEGELKEAKKRHKKLQKEVDKMAKMLKDVEKADDEEGEDDEEEEKEEATEEEEEESEEEESEEEESESEEEEEDEESSEEDDEDAGHDDRLNVFGKRVKRRENVLNALRKGNYLLRANIDRLKDDLEEARIAYHDLEHELSSVLDDM